jgi:hypothetical protein
MLSFIQGFIDKDTATWLPLFLLLLSVGDIYGHLLDISSLRKIIKYQTVGYR